VILTVNLNDIFVGLFSQILDKFNVNVLVPKLARIPGLSKFIITINKNRMMQNNHIMGKFSFST
jgi:hypothetical protein